MRFLRHTLIVAGLALVSGCSDSPTAPPPGPPVDLSEHGGDRGGEQAGRIVVMTRNLYVGADVDAVIGALASPDPSDDLPVLQAAIGTLQATDFSTRARAIAGEIAEVRPGIVGLQEVYELHVDLNPIGLPVKVDLDFLQILRNALAERHLRYDVAARVRDTDASPFPGISLVDYDVVLVEHEHVRVGSVIARQYAYNIGPVAAGVDIRRGFIVLQATIDGRAVTVANTHLESGDDPQIAQLRAAQAAELMSVLGAASPVILTGDLNDTPGSPMYQVFEGFGLRDTWPLLGDRSAGLTCCNAADLSNPVATFTQRIDYVWERGLEQPRARLEGNDFLVGMNRRDRIQGPAGLIWPSDHAGVVAEIELPKTRR